MTFCSNVECQWKGFLKDLDSHISKGCPFEKVLCQQCGQVTALRSVIETHMKNDCKKRPVKCPRCGIEDEVIMAYYVSALTHSTLVNKHYKTCPKWPMRCPNRCDPQLTFTRDGLQEHLASDTECPEKEIDCQFASVGCKEKRKLRYMDEHIQETTSEHLTLLMEITYDLRMLILL